MTIKELEKKLKRIDEQFEVRFIDKKGTEIVKQGEYFYLQSQYKGDVKIYLYELNIITITNKYINNGVKFEKVMLDNDLVKLVIKMLQVVNEYIVDKKE